MEGRWPKAGCASNGAVARTLLAALIRIRSTTTSALVAPLRETAYRPRKRRIPALPYVPLYGATRPTRRHRRRLLDPLSTLSFVRQRQTPWRAFRQCPGSVICATKTLHQLNDNYQTPPTDLMNHSTTVYGQRQFLQSIPRLLKYTDNSSMYN